MNRSISCGAIIALALAASVTCAAADDLFVDLPPTGVVDLELHPSAGVAGGTTLVAFGAPFPPGALDSVDRLAVLDATGAEIPSHVEEIARWGPLGDRGAPDSVRSALVYVEVAFSGAEPLPLALRYGEARGLELGPQAGARATWVAASDSDYGQVIHEPAAYATFSPTWLGDSLLRSRPTPAFTDPELSWFDEALLGYAATAVNDLPSQVTSRIDLRTDHEPWLYDRAMSLFGLYIRTGEVAWLRRAHRATQFYASQIDEDGYFVLKGGEDLKYSYGTSMLTDLLLTGDRDLVAPIERVAGAAAQWREVYEPGASFWTERHQTYALLAALAAWEATGKSEHATRARQVAEASFQHAKSPPGNWPAQGCLVHAMSAHEGAVDSDPVCSPWMSALLADAVFRYYIHARDPAALEFLAGLGDFIADHGTYDGSSERLNHIVPWYLSSSERKFSDSGPFADMEHACDVGGMVLRGAWARRLLGGDTTRLESTASDLLETCRFVLDLWHRPDGLAEGLAEWRLTPPRKFSWWFGTTLDLPWLLQSQKG